ncbi:MAG: sulfotransferase family 2 domain-containing protein [Cyanobacteria bacterium P01_F01_bin.86]
MLVCNTHKFIFVHIPKTAGTSVAVSLSQSFKWNDLIIGGTEFGELVQPHYKSTFGLSKHSSAREIKAIVGTDIWNEYYKFTFVRHPYTRTISLYTYIQKVLKVKGLRGYFRFLLGKTHVQTWQLSQAYLQTKNFSEFIRHEKFLRSFTTASQTNYLIDHKDELDIDFIGKFEDLSKDFATISNQVGLESRPLGKSNVSLKSHKLKKPYLNEADYTYLGKLYAQDFENFTYDLNLRL